MPESLPPATRCPDCGAEIAPHWPQALCPHCALSEAPTPDAASSPPRQPWKPQVPDVAPLSAETAPAATCGRRFGDYELLEEIARGGMGVVFRARQLSLDRVVALKLILSGPFASKQEVLRFRGEAEAAAHLRHPNIVAIHETGEAEGQQFFSMEYVRGRDLGQIVREEGPLAAPRVARYGRALAAAIHYAHQQGILHRDLKPSNVLIDEQDQPRITDFGLAKRVRSEFGLTVTGQVLGSPNFMPPEQTSAKSGTVGPPSDVYGIGAILYHLLTGRPPFQAETLDAILVQLREAEPLAPRLLNPTIPRDLETICLKCLEKDPAQRYATAQDLGDELDRVIRDEPILARPVGPPERLWRWSRRKPALASLIVLVHLVGAAGLAGIIWQWRRAEASATAERAARNRTEAQAYASDMNLAEQALGANNFGRARELLERHRPRSEGSDRRGWEWRYLWEQTRGDESFTLCQKPMAIFSLAVSSDGQWLAVGERNRGHLSIWDVAARQEIRRLPDGERPDIFYIRSAFSPVAPLLAYGSASGYPPTNLVSSVRLWDLQQHRHVGELPLDFLCSGLGFSPDGRRLVTSTPFTLTVWDVQTQKPLAVFQGGSHQGAGTPFAVTPDFSLVAQASAGGRLRVVDLASGTELWNQRFADESVDAVAFSADGQLLATGGTESAIRVWQAATGKPLAQLTGYQGSIVQLLFFPGGRTLASAGTDQAIRLWDITDLDSVPPPRVLLGNELEVWRLALMPDGRTLISGAKDGSVRYWDTTAPLRARGHLTIPGGPFVGFAFTPTQSQLITCDTQGRIERWSGVHFEKRAGILDAQASITAACLMPDREQVALTLSDGTLQFSRWSQQHPATSWTTPVASTNLAPYGASSDWEWHLHRHGNRLAVGRFDLQTVYDFDLDTMELKDTWRAPGTLVSLAFTPDDRFCVMGGYRGQILVRDFRTGTEIELQDFVPNVGDVAVARSGKWVAISSEQGYARLWETGSWRAAAQLGGFLHAVNGLAFSPDNRRLAAGSSGREGIRLFDLEQQQPLITLRGGKPLHQLAFDPSGIWLAGLDLGGELHIWRAPTGADLP